MMLMVLMFSVYYQTLNMPSISGISIQLTTSSARPVPVRPFQVRPFQVLPIPVPPVQVLHVPVLQVALLPDDRKTDYFKTRRDQQTCSTRVIRLFQIPVNSGFL